jgi:PEP-CTERM motif
MNVNSMPLKRTSLAVASLALSVASHAASWDANADFTALSTTNPNGVWGYGYDPAALSGYQFQAFDQLNLLAYTLWTDSMYNSLNTPAFGKNNSSSVVNGGAPGQIILHPGPTPNGDAAILRFTSPATGIYEVSAQFLTGDSGETDAWVVMNGDFASPLVSLGVTSANPTYNTTGISMLAGDTLDFVVGNHGNYFFGTTPLTVQISAVPEPSTTLMCLAGAAWIAFAMRRRTA